MQSTSMLYSFDDPDAAERHQTQYFEIFGNRGIYRRGWSAVTKHRTPWQTVGDVGIAFDDDAWELYDASSDWTQARDLSRENPDKLHELQRLFLIEATRYNVLPLDDRAFERVLPEVSGKPSLIEGNTQRLLPGMGGLTEAHVINLRNRSWSLTSEVEIPKSGRQRRAPQARRPRRRLVVLSQARRADLLLQPLRPRPHLRPGRGPSGRRRASDPRRVRLRRRRPRQRRRRHPQPRRRTGRARPRRTHRADGLRQRGHRRRPRRPPPVTDDYPATDAFTGSIKWIELEAGEDTHDHHIHPEHLIRYAMAKQ